MLISLRWLARHVDLDGVDADELGRRFTLNVAELDAVHRVGAGLEGLVVGLVQRAEDVPDTHLHACTVDVGDGTPRSIVCGAPNVAAGQRVVVALPGAVVGDLEIVERPLRGVLSQGMICSERELGLSDAHEGILVLDGDPAPGTLVSELVPLTDVLFEIDNKSLTHRPDLWGHRGIAREVSAILGRPLRPLELDVDFTDARPLTLTVEAPDACPRYSAVTLEGVTVAPSPLWLRALLHRVGTRAINNVVDATNFVMLDLGNPLHAFDRREVAGDAIVVRFARDGETFTTLDGAERSLRPSDLLIADAERGVALAGIMGGENSEIRDDTLAVVLESANFDAAVIRRTAVRLGLRTESSARFEKSLDPALVADASRAFCRLLAELCPGVRVTSAFMDVARAAAIPPTIALRVDRVHRRLGVELGAARITEMLTRLSFGVRPAQDGVLEVTVPSFRATKDIAIEADLIEEVGRSFGYDHIPPQPATVILTDPHPNHQKLTERAARIYLAKTAGLDEVLSYAFDFDPLLERIGAVPAERLRLVNAISAEMPALRTALGPGLLGVLEKNARREDAIGVFELGRVFLPGPTPDALPHQPTTLGGLVAEVAAEEDPDAALFARLSGVLRGLAPAVQRTPLRLVQGGVAWPWAHPVRQARLMLGEATLGYVAELHPATQRALDVRQRAALFELDLDAWRESPRAAVAYRPLARYPSVYRDFAVVVAEAVRAEAVADAIEAALPGLVRDVSFQSVFRGAGLPGGQKSMAFAVTLGLDDRTLTDADVRAAEEAIWTSLAERVSGTPRA
ncbi:MAG: phenylalanine--tRNA ligase subunit beta [Deltaproteobacteria bacterium]|nr:phenylalanine--tRNA ligase subunit beta [Deltaproteobacteria bacterium]